MSHICFIYLHLALSDDDNFKLLAPIYVLPAALYLYLSLAQVRDYPFLSSVLAQRIIVN